MIISDGGEYEGKWYWSALKCRVLIFLETLKKTTRNPSHCRRSPEFAVDVSQM
jgi:hypothetical protein